MTVTIAEERCCEEGKLEKLLTPEQSVTNLHVNIENDVKAGGTFFLYISTFSVCLLALGLSSSTVWTSPVIAKLRSSDHNINPLGKPATTFQESMLGSLPFVGAIFSNVFLPNACDIFGRKKTLLINAIMQLISTVILAYSTHIFWYYLSRVMLGLSLGSGFTGLVVYLSEIPEVHHRGKIGCFIGLSVPLGNLYVYVLGPLCSVKVLTLFCALPFGLAIICLLTFVPESPVYLISRGKRAEAIKCLKKLRKKTMQEIEVEYKKIVTSLSTSVHQSTSVRELFRIKALRKGFVIVTVGFCISQFSGSTVITTFAGPLFDAAETNLSGDTVAICIGAVKFCSVFLASVIVEKLGKRPLLLVSLMGVAFSQFVLGTFFYLKSNNSLYVDYIIWLPIVAILIYYVFYGVGLGAVLFSLPAEIFPTDLKPIVISIGTTVFFSTGVFVGIIFPIFIRNIGPAYCIWGFGISCFLGFFFFYFMLPEIKGKTIIEIQEMLSK